GQPRRYGDGVFATADGRARFHPTPYRPVAEPTSARFPLRLLTGRLRDQRPGMSRPGRAPARVPHSPAPGRRRPPADAARRGRQAGELVRVASKRGELVLPLEMSDEVASGAVFAAMHWSGQHLSSAGINAVSLPAIDARSRQPELKHAAVRVEKAEFGWHLLAARRGDALAMQAAVQPLLHDCGYAGLSLHRDVDTHAREGSAWLVLRAASAAVMPVQWLAALDGALSLAASADTLEYRDARRGLLKRVAWRADADESFIEGLLWADAQPGGDALLGCALSGEPWHGPRLSAFTALAGGARDPVVCTCRHVTESAIRAELARGADVAALKQSLGCGTVCGSCLPQLA